METLLLVNMYIAYTREFIIYISLADAVIMMCNFVTSQTVNIIPGTATRLCLENSEWDDPYILNCLPEEYQNLLDQVGYTCTLINCMY